MQTLFGFLVAILSPMFNRIMAMLFLSVVSFQGVDTVFQQLQTYALDSYSGMPAAMVQLLGLAGVPAALGLIFGAINVRLAIWTATSVSRWVVKAS